MAKKKRKTKREKIDLARKKTPYQKASSDRTFQETDPYSGLFNQTRLIQKDLLKSTALSFFILASEFVLYWKLK